MADRHDCGSGDIAGAGQATYGIRSAGDIIGLIPVTGQHFEIETKRGHGGRLSKGQQERKRKVEASGGLYFVVHGLPELEFYFGDLI